MFYAQDSSIFLVIVTTNLLPLHYKLKIHTYISDLTSHVGETQHWCKFSLDSLAP